MENVREILSPIRTIYSKALCKMQSAWATLRKCLFPAGAPEAHIELRLSRSDAPFPQAVSNHIQLLQNIGYQVTVMLLQEHIPDEYIGRLSYWFEGQLTHQEYLQIPTGRYAKKTLVSRKIDSSDQKSPSFCLGSCAQSASDPRPLPVIIAKYDAIDILKSYDFHLTNKNAKLNNFTKGKKY